MKLDEAGQFISNDKSCSTPTQSGPPGALHDDCQIVSNAPEEACERRLDRADAIGKTQNRIVSLAI
jgi:hypothetical protein